MTMCNRDDELTSPSAEDEAILEEQAGVMAEAVASLPPELRDIYELWHTGEYSEDALAREFKVSRGTIRARVSRIKTHLVERVDLDTAMATGLFAWKDIL